MTRLSALPLALALIFGSAARAEDDPATDKHEKIIKDMLKGLDDLTEALKSIKDNDSAKAGAKKINEVCDRFDKIADEAKKLPKLPKEKDMELQKKYEKDLKKSVTALQAAAQGVSGFVKDNPELLDAAKRMITVGQKLQSIGGGGK